MQESRDLSGVRGLNGAGHRAIFATEFATWLIAVPQRTRHTGVTNDSVPQVAGDSFCAGAPEHHSLIHVHYTKTCEQAFQDASANFGIIKWRHTGSREQVSAMRIYRQKFTGATECLGIAVRLCNHTGFAESVG